MNKCINKLQYFHLMEYWSAEKREGTVDICNNLNGPQKKKPASKDYLLYDFAYITLFERQNYSDGEQVSGHQGLEGEEDATMGTEGESLS